MAGGALVQSLLRAMDILELAASSGEGLTLTELAAGLGLKVTTTHNLARTLASRGFLERTAEPVRYRVGPAIAKLTDSLSARSLVRDVAGTMAGIFRAHRGIPTLVFAEAHAGRIQTSLRISAEQPRVVERPPGHTLHPYGTASVLAYQAFWTEEERREFRRAYPFWEFGAHLWGDEQKLDRFLAQVRRTGYAAPSLKRAACDVLVAAPVYGHTGAVTGVLGASARRELLGDRGAESLRRAVVAAAVVLSRPDRRAGRKGTQ